jgi:hypothetical protein
VTHAERTALLRSKIEEAKRLLRLAEDDLQEGVTKLAPVLIGDKRTTTVALERSFARLKAARKVVLDLEMLLASLLTSPPA